MFLYNYGALAVAAACGVVAANGNEVDKHGQDHNLRLGTDTIKNHRKLGGSYKTCSDNCIKLFSKDDEEKQRWCFNDGSPVHTNYRPKKAPEVNDISILSYLQKAEEFDDPSCLDDIAPGGVAHGVNDATLSMTFSCCGAGSTTWNVGCGYTATWFRFNCLGLFIKFEPKDTANESGAIEMHISGRFYPTNWSTGGPNAWIKSYSGTQLPAGVSGREMCDTNPHDYSLSWDYRLNKDTGTITLSGSETVIKNNAFQTAGETYTNCSPAAQCANTNEFPGNLDPVKGPYPCCSGPKNQATWKVATTDILSGIPQDSAASKTECGCATFSNGVYTCVFV